MSKKEAASESCGGGDILAFLQRLDVRAEEQTAQLRDLTEWVKRMVRKGRMA